MLLTIRKSIHHIKNALLLFFSAIDFACGINRKKKFKCTVESFSGKKTRLAQVQTHVMGKKRRAESFTAESEMDGKKIEIKCKQS